MTERRLYPDHLLVTEEVLHSCTDAELLQQPAHFACSVGILDITLHLKGS